MEIDTIRVWKFQNFESGHLCEQLSLKPQGEASEIGEEEEEVSYWRGENYKSFGMNRFNVARLSGFINQGN